MLALANPWLLVALGALVVVATGGAYVKGRSDGRAIEIAERATLDEVARESREAAIAAAGEQIARITVNHTTIRQKAEVITRENVVYRDCRNDAVVVGLLDAARGNRAADESAGDRELSGTGTGSAPDVR